MATTSRRVRGRNSPVYVRGQTSSGERADRRTMVTLFWRAVNHRRKGILERWTEATVYAEEDVLCLYFVALDVCLMLTHGAEPSRRRYVSVRYYVYSGRAAARRITGWPDPDSGRLGNKSGSRRARIIRRSIGGVCLAKIFIVRQMPSMFSSRLNRSPD